MPVAEINGRNVRVSARFGSHEDCAFCGEEFQVLSITGRQFYCSESCKEKAGWRRERARPDVVQRNRERCRAWAESSARNTWLLGAPPFGEYLPGGAVGLKVYPPPEWPIELRNTRALHGLATSLLGRPHDPTLPGFTLIPTRLAASGWGMYVPAAEDALRLANARIDGVLFDREVVVSCGSMHRLKSPVVTRRGRRRLRIDCVTPVVIRSQGGTVRHTYPTAANLLSTLTAWTPQRLGITLGPDDARLMLLERATQPEWTPMGGKYGRTGGFVGYMVVECNSVAEWLLRCCETLGFGGKTAFGFGRIRVTNA